MCRLFRCKSDASRSIFPDKLSVLTTSGNKYETFIESSSSDSASSYQVTWASWGIMSTHGYKRPSTKPKVLSKPIPSWTPDCNATSSASQEEGVTADWCLLKHFIKHCWKMKQVPETERRPVLFIRANPASVYTSKPFTSGKASSSDGKRNATSMSVIRYLSTARKHFSWVSNGCAWPVPSMLTKINKSWRVWQYHDKRPRTLRKRACPSADNGWLPSCSRMGRKSGNVVLPFFKSNSAKASSKYVGSTCMYKADEPGLRKILRPRKRKCPPFKPTRPVSRTLTWADSAVMRVLRADSEVVATSRSSTYAMMTMGAWSLPTIRPTYKQGSTVPETTPMLLTIDEKKTIHAWEAILKPLMPFSAHRKIGSPFIVDMDSGIRRISGRSNGEFINAWETSKPAKNMAWFPTLHAPQATPRTILSASMLG